MSAPLIHTRDDGSTLVVCDDDDAQQCPRCQAMHTMLVQRDGVTLCSACAAIETPHEHERLEAEFFASMGSPSTQGPWFEESGEARSRRDLGFWRQVLADIKAGRVNAGEVSAELSEATAHLGRAS